MKFLPQGRLYQYWIDAQKLVCPFVCAEGVRKHSRFWKRFNAGGGDREETGIARRVHRK